MTTERPYFAHSSAIIDEPASIGAGSSIWHFTHVSAGATLGNGCRLGQNVFIAKGVRIGNNVKIMRPGRSY